MKLGSYIAAAVGELNKRDHYLHMADELDGVLEA